VIARSLEREADLGRLCVGAARDGPGRGGQAAVMMVRS